MTTRSAKRPQHFNATYRNFVGCNILRVFGHPVETCCDMLRHVECCWLEFEKLSNFTCNIYGCCMMLKSFGQVRATMLGLSVRTSSIFNSQHVTGGEKRATRCTQQRCDLLNVAIVWPELANVGQTMLEYVALRCCYRFGRGFKAQISRNRSQMVLILCIRSVNDECSLIG